MTIALYGIPNCDTVKRARVWLADRPHLTRSGLTRRVDRLVADGWVQRVYCDTDSHTSVALLQ